ncbi:hypothetical protein JXO59_10525 [candidate division KSB1 bacterium]|nr:hypothetical protein [candidate division KSB1 bacterium]
MLKKYFLLLIVLSFVLFWCDEDSPTDSQRNESVVISQITCDKTTIKVDDIVGLECDATGSNALHYHWSVAKGNTVYNSDIIARENSSDSFDFGKWIQWRPSSTGTWTIEVLAYIREANPSASSGSVMVYNEYNSKSELIAQHFFNIGDEGKTWDKKSITKTVESKSN